MEETEDKTGVDGGGRTRWRGEGKKRETGSGGRLGILGSRGRLSGSGRGRRRGRRRRESWYVYLLVSVLPNLTCSQCLSHSNLQAGSSQCDVIPFPPHQQWDLHTDPRPALRVRCSRWHHPFCRNRRSPPPPRIHNQPHASNAANDTIPFALCDLKPKRQCIMHKRPDYDVYRAIVNWPWPSQNKLNTFPSELVEC